MHVDNMILYHVIAMLSSGHTKDYCVGSCIESCNMLVVVIYVSFVSNTWVS